MKIKPFGFSLLVLCAVILASNAVTAQVPKMLTRTTVKSDRFDFGPGGTIIVAGSPRGSITIEGWPNREVEINAEIEVEAANDADLERLAKVVGFTTDESTGRVSFVSVGPNDKKYLKSVDKKFPKALRNNPFRIDYHIKVPQYSDLRLDGGVGDINISGIEGTIRINSVETKARLDLIGGEVQAVFGKGEVQVTIPTRSWRGRAIDIQLATGDLTVNLPVGLFANLDATILRTGQIENGYQDMKPRVRNQPFTEKAISAKAGAGGISLKFSVGDGTIKLATIGKTTANDD